MRSPSFDIEPSLRQHGESLRQLAVALLSDENAADDAVQEVWLGALQVPPRHAGSVGGWLATAVRNVARKLRRGERRRVAREARASLLRAGEVEDHAAFVAREELVHRLVAAVGSLDAPFREAIWQRYFEGKAPREIAAAGGVPLATVKSRLQRGLQQLREKLGEGTGSDWRAGLVVAFGVEQGAALAAAGVGVAAATVWPGVLLMTASMKSGAVVVAAAAAGAGALWWSMRAPTEVAPVAAVTSTERSDAIAADNAVRVREGSQPDAAAPPPAAHVHRQAAAPAAVDSTPRVQVRVLDAAGNVVPGAEVFYVDQAQVSVDLAKLDAAEQLAIQDDSELWLPRLGVAVVADQEGIVRWPWQSRESRFWYLGGRHGDQFGEAWVSMAASASEVHELRFRTDRHFVVQVLDADRRPAAAVKVRATFVGRDPPDQQTGHHLGTTDAEGRLVARHVQTWSDRIALRGRMLPALVGADLPGVDGGREVDVASPPAETVTLLLPPIGGFEVTVRDAFGEPVANQEVKLLEAVPNANRAFRAATDAAGVASFPRVGLGRRWSLDKDHLPPDRRPVFAGPVARGEVVTVTLQPDQAPVLVGQLLRDGQPVGDTSLSVAAAGLAITNATVSTDAEGRFRIAVAASWHDRRLAELSLRPFSPERLSDGNVALWRGDLPLTVGRHDLGVLVLQPEPVVAAGQFVVAGGGDAPGDLRCVVQAATGDATSPWQSVRLSVRREPHGRFALFGTAPAAALRLEVTTANRFLPVPPMPFVAGARDLRIELRRGGSVRASVVAGSQIAAFCVQPLLVPTETAVDLPEYARFNPDLDPRMPRTTHVLRDDPWETGYAWPAVAPGRYRLELRARGLRRPLWTIADVFVVDGECNEEARLQHLSVPGLRTIELTLPQVDRAESAPGTMGVGVVAALEGDEFGEPCWQIDNRMVLFASTQPLDVLVRLHGFRDRTVRGIVGNQTIELDDGLPVSLRAEGFALPAGRALHFALEAVDDRLTLAGPALYSAAAGGALAPYRLPAIGGAAVDGTTNVRLPAPGRYRISARLRAADGTSADLAAEPEEVQVGAGGAAFTIRLRAR